MIEGKRSVLITGATGIYGSWVLAEALARGYRPIVLMRESSIEQARDRLNAVLAVANGDNRRSVVDLVWGDVRRPQLGMDSRIADTILKEIGAVIHCAGCTSFDPKDDATVWDTNVRSVEHVLAYLSGSNVPLYHVSTAYVAGGRECTVHEFELDGRYGFTNTYESSKWQAERIISSAFLHGAVSGAIFRPGILVGSSTTGAITDFLNVYRFLRLIDLASIQSNLGACSIRLEANADTLSNLVPVDWAAKALWQIIEQAGSNCQTYHLTNPNPNTIEEIRVWATEKLAEVKAELKFVDELDGTLSFMEGFAVKTLRHYQHYTKSQPYFDTTNTRRVTRTSIPFPEIDNRFYDKLLSYARSREWKSALSTVSSNARRREGAASKPCPVNRSSALATGIRAGLAL
ncbi:MAG TPA: SDR family oxidoreductase [Candidatus Hydrogenedentes bacterium]|nr:SDR family oxidoreductase [Candidatus Hydrogenedentota bacterium]